MYTNEMIQKMIDTLSAANKNNCLYKKFFDILGKFNTLDYLAIMHVLQDGSYEAFDQFDSDVCESFIQIYEAAQKESEAEAE